MPKTKTPIGADMLNGTQSVQGAVLAQSLMDKAPLAIALLDKDGREVHTNERWHSGSWAQWWYADSPADKVAKALIEKRFLIALRGRAGRPRITKLTLQNAHTCYARWVLEPWRDDTNEIVGVALFVENITREVEASALASERHAVLDAVLNNIDEAVIACDTDGKMLYGNKAIFEMIDATSEDDRIVSLTRDRIKLYHDDGITPMEVEELPLRQALAGQAIKDQPIVYYDSKNQKRVYFASAQKTVDSRGEVSGAVASLHDVTERIEHERKLKRSEAEARRVAYTDALTGYPNRLSLQRTLGQDLSELCKADGEKLLVLVADIARFKAINGLYGHTVGDRLLGETADRLAGIAGARAIVGRMSGDEFLLLIPLGQRDRETVIGQIRAFMDGPQHISGQTIQLQMVMGSAIWPDDGQTGAELLRRADMARRHAKKEDHGAHCAFEPHMEDSAKRRLQIEQDLRIAVRNNDLTLAYQPIVCAQTGQTKGFEALCRWIHPELGFIPPDVFIEVAENTGDILDLGEWVIRQALCDVSEVDDVRIAVNVSPTQFVDSQFIGRLQAALLEFDFPPSRLELEVTEGLVLRERESVLAQIKALQAMGCRLALDDFGTGYSSLAYLQTLKFDKLKIDRSFVNRLGQDREALALVQCMIQLGKTLSMEVVAEGIETESHALLLRHAGCDLFQGYFYAKPAPWPEAMRRLNMLLNDVPEERVTRRKSKAV